MTRLEDWLGSTWATVLVASLFVAAAIGSYFVLRALLPRVARAVSGSSFRWDDILADKKVLRRISLLAPALLLFLGVLIYTLNRLPNTRGTSLILFAIVAQSTVYVVELIGLHLLPMLSDTWANATLATLQTVRPIVTAAALTSFVIAFSVSWTAGIRRPAAPSGPSG